MKITINFRNGFGCTFEKIKDINHKDGFLKVKLNTGCVREFSCENIANYEVFYE